MQNVLKIHSEAHRNQNTQKNITQKDRELWNNDRMESVLNDSYSTTNQ